MVLKYWVFTIYIYIIELFLFLFFSKKQFDENNLWICYEVI